MLKRLKGVLFVSLAVLTACSSAPSPQRSAKQYLEALRSNNAEQQKRLRCMPGEAVDKEEPFGLSKYEITGQQQTTDSRDKDATYVNVAAKIESPSVGGFSVARTWQIQVWEPDELYNLQKRAADDFNQMTRQAEQAGAEVSKLLGQPYTSSHQDWVPDRSKISNLPFCILGMSAATQN